MSVALAHSTNFRSLANIALHSVKRTETASRLSSKNPERRCGPSFQPILVSNCDLWHTSHWHLRRFGAVGSSERCVLWIWSSYVAAANCVADIRLFLSRPEAEDVCLLLAASSFVVSCSGSARMSCCRTTPASDGPASVFFSNSDMMTTDSFGEQDAVSVRTRLWRHTTTSMINPAVQLRRPGADILCGRPTDLWPCQPKMAYRVLYFCPDECCHQFLVSVRYLVFELGTNTGQTNERT